MAGRKWLITVSELDYKLREVSLTPRNIEPIYWLSNTSLDWLASKQGGLAGKQSGEGDEQPFQVEIQYLPSRLFNFIERLGELDAYSYAVFPKNDVVGIVNDISAQLEAGAGDGGMFDVGRHLLESRTVLVLVGYGDGRRMKSGENSSVGFGWVISPVGSMQPTQKSQLALVAVPAWTRVLRLEVVTG
jgi:hypothetical protein